LAEEVREGRFREDLYYRINVMSLELPPIHERQGDIPLLVAHFLGPGWEIEDAALCAMENYDWPGNIRQLFNAIERGKIMAEDRLVLAKDLPKEIIQNASNSISAAGSELDDLAAVQRAKIIDVLQRHEGNKTHAARALGIDRRKLYRLLQKFAISETEFSE
jgi:DNA-binding NtrC family response regulator